LSKRTKAIKDSIESIKIYLRGKGGLKGIVRREDTFDHFSGYAQYYLGSAMASPNSTQRTMADRIERMSGELVSKVNTFLENEWTDYQSYIQNLDFELFKKIEKVEIKSPKKLIWEETYHVVMEFRTTFLDENNKKKINGKKSNNKSNKSLYSRLH
jgi:hypothetical protein